MQQGHFENGISPNASPGSPNPEQGEPRERSLSFWKRKRPIVQPPASSMPAPTPLQVNVSQLHGLKQFDDKFNRASASTLSSNGLSAGPRSPAMSEISVSQDDPSSEAAQLRSQLIQLSNQHSASVNQLSTSQASVATLKKELETLQVNHKSLLDTHASLKTAHHDLQNELETLSQALFEEANKMVSEERRMKAGLEQQVETLKQEMLMLRDRTERELREELGLSRKPSPEPDVPLDQMYEEPPAPTRLSAPKSLMVRPPPITTHSAPDLLVPSSEQPDKPLSSPISAAANWFTSFSKRKTSSMPATPEPLDDVSLQYSASTEVPTPIRLLQEEDALDQKNKSPLLADAQDDEAGERLSMRSQESVNLQLNGLGLETGSMDGPKRTSIPRSNSITSRPSISRLNSNSSQHSIPRYSDTALSTSPEVHTAALLDEVAPLPVSPPKSEAATPLKRSARTTELASSVSSKASAKSRQRTISESSTESIPITARKPKASLYKTASKVESTDSIDSLDRFPPSRRQLPKLDTKLEEPYLKDAYEPVFKSSRNSDSSVTTIEWDDPLPTSPDVEATPRRPIYQPSQSESAVASSLARSRSTPKAIDKLRRPMQMERSMTDPQNPRPATSARAHDRMASNESSSSATSLKMSRSLSAPDKKLRSELLSRSRTQYGASAYRNQSKSPVEEPRSRSPVAEGLPVRSPIKRWDSTDSNSSDRFKSRFDAFTSKASPVDRTSELRGIKREGSSGLDALMASIA